MFSLGDRVGRAGESRKPAPSREEGLARLARLSFSPVLPCARLAPGYLIARPQDVNIISKVVNPPNGCYAQYIRGSILSLPLYILLVLVLLLKCLLLVCHNHPRPPSDVLPQLLNHCNPQTSSVIKITHYQILPWPQCMHNYGFQNLGHFFPACSPPPLIPSTSMFSPFARPTSAQTPTSLLQSESRPSLSSPLWLCFVRGNISRCYGCKGKICRQGKKPLSPPDDVVLRTVVFQNPNIGVFQASHEPRNVYYHAWKTCIASHFCDLMLPYTSRLTKKSRELYLRYTFDT